MSRALRKGFVVEGEVLEAELALAEGRLAGRLVDGEAREVDAAVRRLDPHAVRVELDGRRFDAYVVRDGDRAWVALDGHVLELRVEEAGGGAHHHAGEEDFAVSPMTGTVVKLAVAPGDAAERGAELFVVEAMKMEYVVRAPRAVVVETVRADVGGQVEQGGVVVTFAASGEGA